MVILLSLTACSWFGGDKACSGDDCDSSDILDYSRSQKTWYCYSLPGGDGWDCRDTRASDGDKPSEPAPPGDTASRQLQDT